MPEYYPNNETPFVSDDKKSRGMKGASCFYDKVSGIHSGNFSLFSHGVFD